MGLFDSIKKATSSAVNSVTGSQTHSKQPTHPTQSSIQTRNNHPTATQSQSQITSPEQPSQTTQLPQNASPESSFLGIPICASGLFKSVIFYTDHLKYGDTIIPYNDLSEISIIHMPSGMTNGTAQFLHKSANKTLTLNFTDSRRFILASEYANDKIAEANGNSIPRRHSIINSKGEKLIVFDDYISIKRIGQGLSGMMGQSNSSEFILNSKISGVEVANGSQLIIDYSNDRGSTSRCVFACSPSNVNELNEIVSYIQNYTIDTLEDEDEEPWKAITGTSRSFPLLGKTLSISEDIDIYNTYRNMYMECALKYSQQLKENYRKRINDFDSFMMFYLPMYKEFLERIIKKTTDILVSAGIWTETNESIMAKHVEANHLAIDDYYVVYESMQITIQNNKQSMNNLTSFVPNLVGGGFGISGAVKGIATATAFNLVRDGAESALVNAMNISGTQKAELYNRINLDTLFDRVFIDYWNVCETLIAILKENGKTIWKLSDDDSAKADNIMKNVSNPNFPQEQFPDVMIAVINLNPYKRTIYELLKSKGADENEVSAISEYFGYTDKTPIVVN